jgi:hypothetical protein
VLFSSWACPPARDKVGPVCVPGPREKTTADLKGNWSWLPDYDSHFTFYLAGLYLTPRALPRASLYVHRLPVNFSADGSVKIF